MPSLLINIKHALINITLITTVALSFIGLPILSSCGLFQAPPPLTPRRISHNLQQVPRGSIMNVIALVPMEIPNTQHPKITNSVAFRLANDVRGNPNSVVLIAQNYFLTGVYTNDGISCQISWQALYPDYRSLELGHGEFGVSRLVNNSKCNPKLGIKAGELVTVTFK